MTWTTGTLFGAAIGTVVLAVTLMCVGALSIMQALDDGLTGSDRSLRSGIDASD